MNHDDQPLRAAFYDSTGCNGCMLAVPNLKHELFALLGRVEILDYRLVTSARRVKRADVAFWEGTISTQESIERLKKVRENSTILVACGACASCGGISGNVHPDIVAAAQQGKYGVGIRDLHILQPMPITRYVEVDHYMYGCPIRPDDLLQTVAALLRGSQPPVQVKSVCTACRQSENTCIRERDICLGPIARGDICEAECPRAGVGCYACMGILPGANLDAVVAMLKTRDMTEEEARTRIKTFNPYVFEQEEKDNVETR